MLNISAVRETRIPFIDYEKQSEFSKQVEPMFEKISFGWFHPYHT